MISIGELCQFRVSSLKALLDLVSLARLHPYISLSVCAFVVLALSSSPSIFWPEPGHASARTSESLQALLSVVTPTRSSWPPNYIALVERAGTSRSKTIQLPLSDVYRDISAGRIELRDPKNDLSDLFRKQVQAYGWLIQFYIDIPLWMNVLRWVAASHLPSFKVRVGFPSASYELTLT
jgi:hypothetical protein